MITTDALDGNAWVRPISVSAKQQGLSEHLRGLN